ncbi:MAG: NAD-dependent epimerase/dehydratase family protein, partial [Deltaproteobacteria bacterium]
MMPTRQRLDPACVLLTGATGFVGKVVLHRLLRQTPAVRRIYVVIRSKSGKSVEARWQQVLASPCFAGMQQALERVAVPIEANLSARRCDLGDAVLERLRQEVTQVIHCAASVDFDLALPLACESNITASLEVLGLARSLPRLRRMVSVSTAYVTPHRRGSL